MEYTTGLVYDSGTLTVPKELVNITQITVLITTTSAAPDTIEVNVGCPEQNMITIYNIAITSNNMSKEKNIPIIEPHTFAWAFIHSEVLRIGLDSSENCSCGFLCSRQHFILQ